MSGGGGIGEHPLTLLDRLLGFIGLALLLALWRSVIPAGGANGLRRDDVLTYTVLAAAFSNQLQLRSAFVDAVWEGSIAMRLVRPVGLLVDYGGETIGSWALSFVTVSLPILVVAPLLGIPLAPHSPASAAVAVVSLGLSIVVGAAVDVLVGLLLVRFHEAYWSIVIARNATLPLLSGAAVPLALLPWGLGRVFGFLPFASTASAPLRLWVGNGAALPLLGAQVAWGVVLWLVVARLWPRARTRMVSLGG